MWKQACNPLQNTFLEEKKKIIERNRGKFGGGTSKTQLHGERGGDDEKTTTPR